jgi:hypothetical protein
MQPGSSRLTQPTRWTTEIVFSEVAGQAAPVWLCGVLQMTSQLLLALMATQRDDGVGSGDGPSHA